MFHLRGMQLQNLETPVEQLYLFLPLFRAGLNFCHQNAHFAFGPFLLNQLVLLERDVDIDVANSLLDTDRPRLAAILGPNRNRAQSG